MVSLSLVQAKAGNTAVKFWPHTGHLGLTPVVLGGFVRVRADFDGSQRSLLASAVTISLRCYEARLGRVGIIRTNVLFDHSQTLWSSSSDSYEELPQADWPFQIILPPSAAGGQSTCHFQTYRVYWRIEATIHHAAAPGIGKLYTKHHDVALIRHESSRIASPSPSPSPIIVHHPLVHSFSVQCPVHFIGPLEHFPVTCTITCRPGVTPSKLAISLKRVIELYDDNNASPSSPVSVSPNRLRPPTPSPPSCDRQLSPYDSPGNATSRCQIRDDDTQITLSDMEFEDDETTNTLVTDDADSLQPLSVSTVPVASKSSRHLLLQESSSFPRSPIPTSESPWRANDQFGAVGDTYSQQVTMHIPAPKSKSHWAVGQSMQTAMARVKFVLSCKVTLTTPNNSTEVYKLSEHEVMVAAVSQDERDSILRQARADEEKERERPWRHDDSSSSRAGGRCRRRGHSPELATTSIAGLHPSGSPAAPSSSTISPSNKRPYPNTDCNASIPGVRTALAFFDRRGKSASPPSSIASFTTKLGGTIRNPSGRRPRTSTGSHTSVSTAGTIAATIDDADSIKLCTHPDKVHAFSRGCSRRRHSDDTTETLVVPIALPGWRSSGVKSSKLGFEADQIKAWEEELDRIAIFSKRKSSGIGHHHDRAHDSSRPSSPGNTPSPPVPSLHAFPTQVSAENF